MAPEIDGFGGTEPKKGMGVFGKVAIGCGLVVLLCCVGLGYCGYQFAKLVPLGREIAGATGSETGKLLAQAREKSDWTQPEEPATSAERIEVFLHVREGLYERAVKVASRGKELEEMEGSFFKKFAAAREFLEELVPIRKDYARALVEEGMSDGEYSYLFRLVCMSGIIGEEPDLSSHFRDDLEGFSEVPEDTRTLVEGYADRFADTPVTEADAIILGIRADEFSPDAGRRKE
ncbi:MAG: hypothetical protein O6952_03630 [Planctomycetota bacterium]|nr:hypothetical protein [Planctomycetota bacterium]